MFVWTIWHHIPPQLSPLTKLHSPQACPQISRSFPAQGWQLYSEGCCKDPKGKGEPHVCSPVFLRGRPKYNRQAGSNEALQGSTWGRRKQQPVTFPSFLVSGRLDPVANLDLLGISHAALPSPGRRTSLQAMPGNAGARLRHTQGTLGNEVFHLPLILAVTLWSSRRWEEVVTRSQASGWNWKAPVLLDSLLAKCDVPLCLFSASNENHGQI